MTALILGRGVCDYLPELKLLLSCWPMEQFDDDEWDAYVAQVRRYAHSVSGFRVISWNMQNATPRPDQQRRMSAQIGTSAHKVAIVNRDQTSGFASSVLAFVNPHIRTFTEQQWSEVWTHLGLDAADQFRAERALQRLRESIK